MNHPKEYSNLVSTQDLYVRALAQDVPFHKFSEWIEKELQKANISISREKRMSLIAQVCALPLFLFLLI